MDSRGRLSPRSSLYPAFVTRQCAPLRSRRSLGLISELPIRLTSRVLPRAVHPTASRWWHWRWERLSSAWRAARREKPERELRCTASKLHRVPQEFASRADLDIFVRAIRGCGFQGLSRSDI